MLIVLRLVTVCVAEPARTIEVKLQTRTGGGMTGLVVAHNDHGIVVVNNQTPYVFSWRALEPGSAYVAQRDLLYFERGGKDKLTAEDRYQLGVFALDGGRNDLAAVEFRQTQKLDGSYAPRIKEAFDRFRAKAKSSCEHDNPIALEAGDELDRGGGLSDEDENRATVNQARLVPDLYVNPGASQTDRSARVADAYRRFNEEVIRVLGKTISTYESEHFLITTDFPERQIPQLKEWSESMYRALIGEFDWKGDRQVFLAKCPIYCFRSRVRFRKFARHFDGYDARGSIGYTRSIEANGHTHVVLLREGNDEADDDRFACTLVHEGTHAFVHRLYSNRLIPHWVNEGFADMMADHVLGDRCAKHKDATLLADCFVRYNWSIRSMLEQAGPINVEQYPIAHSVVRYLYESKVGNFSEFVRLLKDGASLADALAQAYDGSTLDRLESDWRDWVRRSMPADRD